MFYMTAQPSLAAEMEKPPSGGFFAFGLTPGSPGSGLCRLPFAIRGMTSKHPAAGNRQFRAVQRIEMKFADAVRGKIVNLLGGDGSEVALEHGSKTLMASRIVDAIAASLASGESGHR